MIFATRLVLGAAVLALSVPAMAADSDQVTATPSRVAAPGGAVEKGIVPQDEDSFALKTRDYLKTVHGEVTAMVDTNGGYAVSGTAVLPLGENATAIITLSQGQGWWRGPYGYEAEPLPAPFGAVRRGPRR